MKRVDPSTGEHFCRQPMEGLGKATGMEIRMEFVDPCLDVELVISSSWVSRP